MTPLELHRRLLYVRRSEELLASLYKRQEMRTPTHFGIGQEAVAVGVCAALNLPHDVVVTHHRSHAAYLACGGDFEALCAELYGRETGCSRGRGGSVHLTAPETGFLASSAILGEMVAVATGAALAFKMNGEDRVAVSFFGEACCEEGIVYESMNYAAINRLPVIYVCENNGYSTESPLSKRQPANTSLAERALAFKVAAQKIDGNDVSAVYEAAKEARELALNGQPVFLEASTYRWLEHVGPNFDHDMKRTYRSEEELREWQKRDPLVISAECLPWVKVAELDDAIKAELGDSAARAYAGTMPDKSTLFENVW